jgi:hypothetical protein
MTELGDSRFTTTSLSLFFASVEDLGEVLVLISSAGFLLTFALAP